MVLDNSSLVIINIEVNFYILEISNVGLGCFSMNSDQKNTLSHENSYTRMLLSQELFFFLFPKRASSHRIGVFGKIGRPAILFYWEKLITIEASQFLTSV